MMALRVVRLGFLGLLVGALVPAVLGTFTASSALAQEDNPLEVEGTARHPLAPPDTSSPRATFRSFLTEANAAWRTYLRAEPRKGERGDAARHVGRAARCFDLSGVPPAQRAEIATQTVVLMLDVFNRIEIPAPGDVPDAEAMERKESTRYTLPYTSITIERMEEGPRAGEWLFSSQVVENAKEYYLRTRSLPVKPGAVVEDGFEIYVAIAGWMIPVSWIENLPEWAQEVYFGQTLWQWVLLALLLAVLALLAWVAFRWSRRAAPRERASAWRKLVGPASLMLLASFAHYMIEVQLGITGTTFMVLQTFFDSTSSLAAAWAVMLVGSLVATAIVDSPRIHPGSLDAQLVSMGVRIASLVVAVLIVAEGARAQGIPLVGVVAGLGVGGLAIALAAQSTLENFIGSLTLFADRPVRVGDFCRFGDQVGTVEEIGLRSTRIRTLERSVLTVPNAEFSRLQLDNLSRRDRILFRTTLNLRLETTSEQLERVLSKVRARLLGHESVDDDPARVRLVAAGPYSLDLEIFAYVKTSDWNEFVAIREQLLMQILREIEMAGTALAPPAQTTYLRSGEDDPEKAAEREPEPGRARAAPRSSESLPRSG